MKIRHVLLFTLLVASAAFHYSCDNEGSDEVTTFDRVRSHGDVITQGGGALDPDPKPDPKDDGPPAPLPFGIKEYVYTLVGYVGGVGNRDGIGETAGFYQSYRVDVSKDGTTMYVADTGNHAIRKIDILTRNTTLLAGKAGVRGDQDTLTGPATEARLDGPRDLCLSYDNASLFVLDQGGSVLRRIDMTTGVTKTIVATLSGSRGIVCHPGENKVFIADDSVIYSVDVSDPSSPNVIQLAGSFNDLWDLAINDAGDVLFASENISSSIYKVRIFIGGGTSVDKLITSPSVPDFPAISYVKTPEGIEYLFAVASDNKIRAFKLDTDQEIDDPADVVIIAGADDAGYNNSASGADARFNRPYGLTAVGDALYVADTMNSVIRKVALSGDFAVSTVVGNYAVPGLVNGDFRTARFNAPLGITSVGDRIYFSDGYNRAIRYMLLGADGTGTVGTVVSGDGYADSADGAPKMGWATYLAEHNGDIYFSDSQNTAIRKITLKGDGTLDSMVTVAGGKPLQAGFVDGVGLFARFKMPTGLVVDGGYLYVADQFNHAIRRMELATAMVTTVAGNGSSGHVDGDGASSRFNQPDGLAVNGGYLYVSEQGNHRIRRVSLVAPYQVTTIAGSGVAQTTDGTGVAASFNKPGAMAMFDGYLYVVEKDGQVLRKIDPSSSSVTTVAGIAGAKGTIDGKLLAASFNKPSGLYYHAPMGGFLVTDADSHSIRWVQIGEPLTVDTDKDGVPDSEDNCPDAANPYQVDVDQDGIGDDCDNDIPNYFDFCGDEVVYQHEEQIVVAANVGNAVNHALLPAIEATLPADVDAATVVQEAIRVKVGPDDAAVSLDVTDTPQGVVLTLKNGADGSKAWYPASEYRIKFCHQIATVEGKPIKPFEVVVTTRQPNQPENIGISHSGGTRSGVFYLPKGFDPNEEYPLVVLLHGLGGDGAGMVNAFTSLADSKGLILFGPDGFLRKDPFGSNNIYYFNPNYKIKPAEDYTFIMATAEKILDAFPVDTSRVMVAGMSMGAPSTLFVGTKSGYFTHGALMHGVRWNYDEGAKNDVPNVLWYPWEQTPINNHHPLFWYSTSVDDWVTNYDSIPFPMTVDSDLSYMLNAGLTVTNKFCYTGGHTMGTLEKKEMIDWFLYGTAPSACP